MRYQENFNQTQQPAEGIKTKNRYNQETFNNTEKKERVKRQKIGTLSSMVDLTKTLVHDLAKNKEKRKKLKEMTQQDILAIVLTIIVVIVIGIILWFIPFTNGWVRQLLFENPLFNWIGKLFS